MDNLSRPAVLQELRTWFDQRPGWEDNPLLLPFHFTGSRAGHQTIYVDVAKADACWTSPRRIEPQADAEPEKPAKLLRWLRSMANCEAPDASRQGQAIGFGEGRHRFAILRDTGCRVLPLQVRDAAAWEDLSVHLEPPRQEPAEEPEPEPEEEEIER